MTLTATPNTAGSPPFTTLSYTNTAGATTAQIQRLDPDGVWRPVRTGEPATLSAGSWSGQDYEAPYGVLVTYRAAPNVGSADQVTANLNPYDANGNGETWLIHPGTPALSVRIDNDLSVWDFSGVMSAAVRGTRTQSGNRTVLRAWGATNAVVITDGTRYGPASQLNLKTVDNTSAAKLDAIFASSQPLLINPHPARLNSFARAWASFGDITDDVDTARYGYRTWAAPYDTVDRPVGSYQTTWTWAAAANYCPTISDLQASFPTLAQLVADTPIT